MQTVSKPSKEACLDKISKLLLTGNEENLRFGLILICRIFTKEEIEQSLVYIKDIDSHAPPKAREYQSPFGLKGSGHVCLKVICNGFCLHMGFGPYIIYDKRDHTEEDFVYWGKNEYIDLR